MSHLDVCILTLLVLLYLLIWHYICTQKEEDAMSEHDEETNYLNYYHCNRCDLTWTDVWSCMCNDKCSACNREIQPFKSEELSCR